MNKFFIIVLLFALVVITACDNIDVSKISDEDMARIANNAIVCNSPYIRFETGCCLDQNNNNVCDVDEGLKTDNKSNVNTELQKDNENELNSAATCANKGGVCKDVCDNEKPIPNSDNTRLCEYGKVCCRIFNATDSNTDSSFCEKYPEAPINFQGLIIPNIDMPVIDRNTNSVEITFRNNKGVSITLPLTTTVIPAPGVTCANAILSGEYNGAPIVANSTQLPGYATFLLRWDCDDLNIIPSVGKKFEAYMSFDYQNVETRQILHQAGCIVGTYKKFAQGVKEPTPSVTINTTIGLSKYSDNLFIGGTEGLRTTFLPGSPPATITDGGSSGFSIVIKAENVGESNILSSDGFVQIWGLDPRVYGNDYVYPDFKKYFYQQEGFGTELRSAELNFDGSVSNGSVAMIDFGDLRYIPTIQGDLRQKVWANTCYKYSTRVSTKICIKNSVDSGTAICEVEGEKTPQNSGAPIHVTSLKEAYAGNDKIGFTVTIAHVGNGDNFFKDTTLACVDVASNVDAKKVHIKFNDVQISGKTYPVVCYGMTDGYVILYKDGSGKESTILACTIDVSGINTPVETPLTLELSYVYLQHLEQSITITHISK
jgi:hypothetical protein